MPKGKMCQRTQRFPPGANIDQQLEKTKLLLIAENCSLISGQRSQEFLENCTLI